MYIQSEIGKKVKAAFHFLYSKLAMMVFSLRRGWILTHLIPKYWKIWMIALYCKAEIFFSSLYWFWNTEYIFV